MFAFGRLSCLTVGISSLYGIVVAGSLAERAVFDPTTACPALINLRLENTTILNATHLAQPSTISTPGSCQSSATTSVPLCRVFFVINTTSTSAVHAEAWLPDTFFGRFLTVGNGGLGGCIDYSNLDLGSLRHFATVGTDNGHDGQSGAPFLNHPEVINDFAFRAVHVGAVIGKQILQAYYGAAQHHSYYLGCSTGGRQGTQEALLFPNDFDGIVAGSPATDFNHLIDWSGFLSRFVGAPHSSTSPSFIPASLWTTVGNEIMNQCDALDGVVDGIITEPDACDFRPEVLQCTGGNTTNCLTDAQLQAVLNVHTPLFGTNGKLLYPRFDPGAVVDGGSQGILSGQFFPFTSGWFANAIFNDSNHDFSNFGFPDVAIGDAINPGGIATFNGDLSAFMNRGGKFITYHGRQDPLIASGNSKRVYNLISQTLRIPILDAFYRLFLIPGMGHCGGGRGASNFDQGGGSKSPTNDSAHSVLLAIVNWVEGGVAPDTIIGTASNGATRTHCRFPQRSVFNGTQFVCVATN